MLRVAASAALLPLKVRKTAKPTQVSPVMNHPSYLLKVAPQIQQLAYDRVRSKNLRIRN